MHDLATIQRMNREATEAHDNAVREVSEQVEGRLAAEREAAMQRHPAGTRITEPAIDPAARTTGRNSKPVCDRTIDGLLSPSALELAEEVLTSFTSNGAIPFALSGEKALKVIALAIEADRAKRGTK